MEDTLKELSKLEKIAYDIKYDERQINDISESMVNSGNLVSKRNLDSWVLDIKKLEEEVQKKKVRFNKLIDRIKL